VDLPEYVAERRRGVDAALDRLLPPPEGPSRTLAEAMRYAVLGGGKRLRPILVVASYEACGGHGSAILEPAAAIELIHAYSLIHDDLPAMDDDDLRRGRLTLHRAFGEAEAVLAGDALLTLAFEVLGTFPVSDAAAPRRAEAVVVAARRAGIGGMVGGQIADLEAERREVTRDDLRWIHRHKTGALISGCCEIGAIHAGAVGDGRAALAEFGESLGLAFQIADDLLDRTGSRAALGKTPGKDERAGKATYPALLGGDASRSAAEDLVEGAVSGLQTAGLSTPALESVARYAVTRTG
jgi:geranylgeranyl diphosphate synthase type II